MEERRIFGKSDKPRIILFGRTGSGKSTIANMLARGHLDAPLLFKTSSGVRGETLCMQREDCDEMVIVDTVGLGESDHGTVSTREAQRILYDFFTKVEEGFHYFAFVRKWGRNDYLDEQLWKFFREAFKGAEENFLVIITHFDKPEAELEDPETNKSLVKMYAPCRTWVCVNFPDESESVVPISEAMRRMGLRHRTRSLQRLKQAMVQFWGPAVAPDVCLQLRVGRVLLVGRRAAAKGIVANLLVKGTFDLLDSDLPFPIVANADAATGSRPFTEGKGRRWEVVAMHSFDSYMGQQDHCKLARTLAASILDTLMHKAGVSHVVFVHESGHGHKQDELIDKIFWQIMLAFLSRDMQKDRLVLVIAGSSRASTAENARFKDCQNLVYLDIPSVHDAKSDKEPRNSAHSPRISVGERLDSARGVLEQVLQKEVDTKSTFFNLDNNLSQRDKQQIIEEVSEAYLTPVMRAMSNKEKSGHLVIRVLSNPALSQLSNAYRKIVNKDDRVNMVKHMWNERPAEAAAAAAARAARAERAAAAAARAEDAADAAAEAAAAVADDPNFCESYQLVVGEGLDLSYLELKCRWDDRRGLLGSIEVTVESHDQGRASGSDDPAVWIRGTYEGFQYTWGELAVLTPDEGEIGERVKVYFNLHAVKEWQRHTKAITDPKFLGMVGGNCIIALFLRSHIRWWNYTRYASIKLVYM